MMAPDKIKDAFGRESGAAVKEFDWKYQEREEGAKRATALTGGEGPQG